MGDKDEIGDGHTAHVAPRPPLQPRHAPIPVPTLKKADTGRTGRPQRPPWPVPQLGIESAVLEDEDEGTGFRDELRKKFEGPPISL